MHRYSYERLVQWSECDPAGIIFFAQYGRWMNDGLLQMFLGLGVDPTAALSTNKTVGMPSVELSMKFLAPAQLHDRVVHEVSVVRVGSKSLAFAHSVTRGETLLMEGQETRVWVNLDRSKGRISAEPVPPSVRSLLEAPTQAFETVEGR